MVQVAQGEHSDRRNEEKGSLSSYSQPSSVSSSGNPTIYWAPYYVQILY